jgi:hypothetical protein
MSNNTIMWLKAIAGAIVGMGAFYIFYILMWAVFAV